jgi:hypothetical protein
MTWSSHTDAAVAAIEGVLGKRGQWPGWVVMQNAPLESTRDMAPPLSALGMLCLAGVPGSGAVLARSAEHLRLTVLPGGVWRYYANIAWDTDDTAMCALALGPTHALANDTRRSLQNARGEDGLFLTWPLTPPHEQGVDAVANAHVVAALGPDPLTAHAVDWLLGLVSEGTETAHCCYYPDPLDTHMAIGRAVAAGVEALVPALTMAAPRAVARLEDRRLPSYRRAQAILVALAGGVPAPDLRSAADVLAQQQQGDGFWAPEALYTAVSTQDVGGLALYTSRAVTTALCARALVAVQRAAGFGAMGS